MGKHVGALDPWCRRSTDMPVHRQAAFALLEAVLDAHVEETHTTVRAVREARK